MMFLSTTKPQMHSQYISQIIMNLTPLPKTILIHPIMGGEIIKRENILNEKECSTVEGCQKKFNHIIL